jgi:hypothetical protein
MNTPLLKFAEQAGLYVDLNGQPWPRNMSAEESEAAYKKFAELIVKESAMICDTIGKEARKEWKTKYNPHDDGRADGAWQCEEAILEHFGVEE